MPEIASSAAAPLADPRPIGSANSPSPVPRTNLVGRRWSWIGRDSVLQIVTLLRPMPERGPGWWWARTPDGVEGDRCIPFREARYQGPDWSCWLPSADLPVKHDNRPKVGEIWAVGAMGYRVVVGIEKVDPVNQPAVRAMVYAADPEMRRDLGKVVTLAESMMNAVKVGDDVMTPICAASALSGPRVTPKTFVGIDPGAGPSKAAVVALGIAPKSVRSRHQHRHLFAPIELDTAPIPGTLAAITESFNALFEQWRGSMVNIFEALKIATPEQLEKMAAKAAAGLFGPEHANPACGCSQETVCAAHEKPNQSAGPGEVFAKGEAIHAAAAAAIDEALADIAKPYQKPTVTPVQNTRTLVSMNGRDWLNYAHLDEAAEPLNKYPHWQIWRGDELLIFSPSPPAPARTCERNAGPARFSEACGKPALVRPRGAWLCDDCYLDVERVAGKLTARRPEHWQARMRMDVMAYNEMGHGRLFGPELPRPCTPTAWGGIFDPQADR